MAFTERTEGCVSVYTFTDTLSDEEFAEYMDCLDRSTKRQNPYVVICEATRSRSLSGKQAKRMAEWTKTNYAILHEYCRGIAFVIPSFFVRGGLRAIFAMQSPPYPSTVVETMAQAIEWVKARAPEPLPSSLLKKLSL
jgi:hypothetical protein